MRDTTAIRAFTAWFRLKHRIYDQNSCLHCLAAQARAWKDDNGIGDTSDLMRIFGLRYGQAQEVFFGPPGGVTREQAVAMLEYLADTGRINWNPPARDPVLTENSP